MMAETSDIETSSTRYARRFAGRVGAWFLQVQEQAVLDLLRPYPGAHVLDVGGGHGQLTGGLLRSGYRVSVLSSASLSQTQIAPWVTQGRVDFRMGSVSNIPFPDCSFDVVLSLRLLSHVEDWMRFISETTRVARRAVVFDYAELRSMNALAPRLFGWKKYIEGDTRPFNLFKEADLAKAFSQNGFKIVQSCPQFLLPMVLHRGLKALKVSLAVEGLARKTGLTRHWGSPVVVRAQRQEEGAHD